MKIKSPKTIKAVRIANPRCEDCRQGFSQHVHHEPPKGSKGQDIRVGLMAVCNECHNERHTTGKNRERMESIICRREGCTPEDRQAVIDLIWRADKAATREWLDSQASDWEPAAYHLLRVTLDEAGVV